MSSSVTASMLGSTQNGDATALEDNALSFNDSDFYLNMDDVDIGPQIGQGAFSKVYLGRYLGELVRAQSLLAAAALHFAGCGVLFALRYVVSVGCFPACAL